MPKFGDFGAWVKVGGRRILELNTKVDEADRSTVCYMLSETDQVSFISLYVCLQPLTFPEIHNTLAGAQR